MIGAPLMLILDYMTVDDLDDEILGFHIFGSFKLNDFAFVVFIENFFLHDAFAHCGHLRTAVGIDDRCHDIAAESGTDLIKQVGIFFSGLGILVVSDFKRSTVCGEAAVEA